MKKITNNPSIKDLLKYLSKHYKFVHNELTGQLLYKRRDSKSVLKPFDRGHFYRILFERFDKYPASMIRESLKAIYYSPKNDVLAFCGQSKYLSHTCPKESPFDQLDRYIKLTDVPPFSFGDMLEFHLVRAIRCALEGTPNRFIFSLVSRRQYVGKTHFIEWLFPEELQNYCMSTLSGRKEKRDTILASKFLVNIDEFSGTKKSNEAQLKAMISQKSAALWVPFKNNIEQRPRITSFFATKNISKEPALSADDDNSRFIIYNVKEIDWSYAEKIDVNELWQYAIAKAHDPDYDPYPTIEEVKKIIAYNKKYTRRSSKARINSKRTKGIALGAMLGTVATAFLASPFGRAIIGSLFRLFGVG